LAQDNLGGTALVMNSTGGVVSRMGYYPYGMTWTEQGVMPTDRLYTGQQRFGAKSGMYNYVSRFYSADMGRFPQPDSIQPSVFEPQALSRYTYVNNNPTNFTDPSGHFGYGVIPVDPGGGGGGDPVLPPGYDDGSFYDRVRNPGQTIAYQCGGDFTFKEESVNGTVPGREMIVTWGGYIICEPPGVVTDKVCQARLSRLLNLFSEPLRTPRVTARGDFPCVAVSQDELIRLQYRIEFCYYALAPGHPMIPWHCHDTIVPRLI